jgi:ubiquinone/menaquinone biosynthesis C-methylase UbiE
MKPLYLTPAVRNHLGQCLRPGGESLTRRILDLLDPTEDSACLDAGCGAGASLAMLREHGVRRALGLDLEEGLLQEARGNSSRPISRLVSPLICADLEAMPLRAACLDMVLCECAWNLTNRDRVLSEFARVLKPGGRIALSDIYARAPGYDPLQSPWPVRCCFSRATDLETVENMFAAHGFEVTLLEDHTGLLRRTAAEFVFAHGSLQGFWQAVTGDASMAVAACAASAAARPGLFLLIARRRSE